MNNAFQLPEKDFFSVNEIAARWDCDVSDVEHYIYASKALRPSIISSYMTCLHHIYGRKWASIIEDKLTKDDFIIIPKLLYVDPENFVESTANLSESKNGTINKEVGWFHDFRGKVFALSEVSGLLTVDSKIELEYGVEEIQSNFVRTPVGELYITKEERDRFENENSSPTETNKTHINEKASELKDPLHYWRLNSELNISQTALLIIDLDPSDFPNISGAISSEMPKGYEAVFSALITATENGELTPSNVDPFGQDPLGRTPLACWETKFFVGDVTDWLAGNGMHSAFFNEHPATSDTVGSLLTEGRELNQVNDYNQRTLNEQAAKINKLEIEISLLKGENNKLKNCSSSSSSQFSICHPCKNKEREDYAPELVLALELWEELYLSASKPEYLSHTAAATHWLDRQNVTQKRQKERLSAVTNPAKNKNDQQEK